jgi:four helix bundle protein
MELVEEVYRVTRTFPREEIYGLTAQTRRSAVSIPSNIAEGHSRASRKEFRHHVAFARGSLAEVETQLLIALRLNYIDEDTLRPVWHQMQSIGRMLNGLLKAL